MPRPKVSVVIPTFNRRDLLIRAIDGVVAQTFPVEEIVVIDDGSTDGTGEAVGTRFGSRVTYIHQANAGVSAARNRGLALTKGDYISLLDSDDEWHPEKTARQVSWLDAHPAFGMVLCDVVRVTPDGKLIDVFRRRDAIPEDGHVLRWVLRNPSLVPASAMFRREVLDTVGMFDPDLASAEDIDFHLRVARRWPIGVVSEPLVRAMRGHAGLSSVPDTYGDYQRVVDRFVAQCRGEVPEKDLDAGVALACLRNARGLIFYGAWAEAWRLALRGMGQTPDGRIRREALRLIPLALRHILKKALGAVGGSASTMSASEK